MKAAVVYSTLTGNTKKVAEAICAGLGAGAEVFDVTTSPDVSGCDLVAVGFWVDKGQPDAKTKEFMKTVKGKKVFTFFTLGAKPASAHAYKCAYTAKDFYGEGCTEIGCWFCQGAIDPKLIEMMRKMPAGGPHSATPENEARWSAAASHPDAADLAAATEAAKAVRHANQICYLQDGTVVEMGTHEELMAKNGYYHAMSTLTENGVEPARGLV